jgi:hypothetical protein
MILLFLLASFSATAFSSRTYVTDALDHPETLAGLFSCLARNQDVTQIKWVIIMPDVGGLPLFRRKYPWIEEVGIMKAMEYLRNTDNTTWVLAMERNVVKYQAMKELIGAGGPIAYAHSHSRFL